MFALFYIGIDISKKTLDVAVFKEGRVLESFVIENRESAIKDLLVVLKERYHSISENTIFCAEHMGIYADFLRAVMVKKQARLCLESPLRIRLSLGIQRGKSDALDAVRIAQYAWRFSDRLELWTPPRPPIQQLRTLMSIRKRLIKMGAMLKSPKKLEAYYLSEPDKKALARYIDASYNAIRADIKQIDTEVELLFKTDERLNRLLTVMTSVPSIGIIIATEIIICTNEFRDIDCPKKFASYCGIAPFSKNSGTSVRTKPRISPIANKDIKTMLHLASMGVTRKDRCKFQVYYQRKVAEGKNKMSVLNALRNKLVTVVFACVRDNASYHEPEPAPG